MQPGARSFGAELKALREKAGFTQEELATISGLSVHAVSALERGQRRRPQLETVRALSAALDLPPEVHEALLSSARASAGSRDDDKGGRSLPLPVSALIGRDAELKIVRRWFADPTARLVTFIGPGGVGKTRLAVEVARAIAREGSMRVAFVPLAPLRDPAFVASAIAEALGLADVGAQDLPKRACAACEDCPTLMVLDNFEHLLDAASLVADLLATVPSLRLLVTSRAPLRVRGEREYAVAPLALEADTDETPTTDLAPTPAVRLFIDRIRDVQSDFRLTLDNGPTLAAICRRLDALPLALEIAAPWIKVQTAEDLLRRLEHDVLLSTAGPRDLPERQQTMNATVAWSYRLLDADERRAFRRFGALPGVFPIDAAAAVLTGGEGGSTGADHALSAVAGLIDKSLLLRVESPATTRPVYQMLETVRAYAMLELTAAGEREDAFEGLARYCIREAALAAEELIGPRQVEWFDRLREDLDNYRAVLARLIEQSRAADAADMASALLFFWLIRGHATEGLRWYEQILRLPSLPPMAEAKALLGAAATWHTHGERERARTCLTRAIALARGAGAGAEVAQAAWMFGHVEHGALNLDAAQDWFTRSLEEFRALGIQWGIGSALSGLGWVALAIGDGDEAERLAAESASALRSCGPWFLALGLYIRVVLALRRGKPDEVFALMRQSLTRVREFQDMFAVVYGLVPLAAAAAEKGDDAWVARILGARHAISERAGATLVDPSLGDLCEKTGRDARARLGPDRWAQAYAVGRKSSIDALLNDIDRALG